MQSLDKWLNVSAWFIRGWITSLTARISEGKVRAQARTNKQAQAQTNKQAHEWTNKQAYEQTNKQAHKQANKQCQKQIIITIMITTRHWVKSMRRRHIISRPEVWAWKLDQKSCYKVWVRGLSIRCGSSHRSDTRRL